MGPTLTVGLLTPHVAAGPEVELPEMASGRVTTVLERLRAPDAATGPETRPPSTAAALIAMTRPAALDGVAARFREGSVDAVAFASTTTGYALGHGSEAALLGRLREQCGVPTVASASSAVEALRTCQVRRVTLVHPPWFDDQIDQLGVGYFNAEGFDITLRKATGLPDDPNSTRTEDIVDWVGRHLGDDAEAVFLAGNGFRAAGAIERLERETGRLVLEANQVMLWSLLAASGTAWDVTGYGTLFQTVAPASASASL